MKLDANELPHLIIGAAMEVHRVLGPGLPREVYRDALAHELRMREIIFEKDAPLPVAYKGLMLEAHAALDLVVERSIIVMVESVDTLKEVHKSRMRHALRLSRHETGLIVNFNVMNLRNGVKRMIVSEAPPNLRYQQSAV